MQSSTDDIRASGFRAVRRNPLAPPIKEKRLCRFSTLDFKDDSEQCGTCNEREARSSPRRIYVRLLSQSARKRRALCPYKELQSAFIPFIASERMRYESLRADKRKTARPFFAFRLIRADSEQWPFAAFQKLQFLESFLDLTMRCLKLSHYNTRT